MDNSKTPPEPSASAVLDEVIITPSMPIIEAIEVLNKAHLRIILVAGQDRKLLGVVSDANIRRAILNKVDFNRPISEIMVSSPITASEGATNEEVRAIMERTQIYEIPVVDDGGRIVDLRLVDDILHAKAAGDMTAVIMVGGLGSRLKPLTDDMPKALIDVGGQPILFILMDQLIAEGFTRIYLTLNFKGAAIRDAVDAVPRFKSVVEFINEDKQLGTAGALKLLPETPKKPFLVLNGDLLTKVAMAEMVRFHELDRNLMTVALKKERFSIPYGCATVEGTRILKMEEKPDHIAFINAGVYVLDPIALQKIPADTSCDMTDVIDQLLAAELRVGFFPVHEYWLDIGRPSQLEQARSDYEKHFMINEEKSEKKS